MNNMGVLYERKGDFAKAAEYYRKGFAIKEDTKAPLKALVISEINVARSILEVGQYDEAVDLLKTVLNGLKIFQISLVTHDLYFGKPWERLV